MSRPRSARSLQQDNDPSLLITDSPRFVRANTAFTLKVSTRNLIRDRFLGAAVGGYYLESSVLTNGIQRGHFHTACRMLASLRSAPDPATRCPPSSWRRRTTAVAPPRTP